MSGPYLYHDRLSDLKDGKFPPADLYVWWARNQADVELVKKAGKYHGMTLKPLVLKIGKID